MIRLTDLAGNGSFTMGGKKFEYGKVYSNPFASALTTLLIQKTIYLKRLLITTNMVIQMKV